MDTGSLPIPDVQDGLRCERETGGCPSWMLKLSLSELSAYKRSGMGGEREREEDIS